MKRLRYMRHLYYEKKNGGVPQRELDRAQKEAPKSNYTDIFYSPTYRTIQTALAIVAGLKLPVRIHEPIEITEEPKLKEIFELIPKWGFGLVIGHAEIIEKASQDLGYDVGPLPNLGYVDFGQLKNGIVKLLKQS